MLGRKQEINLQLSQILDSCLLVVAFYVSHSIASALRLNIGWLGGGDIPALREFFWLMSIIVPFTPIILEFQGYYDSPLLKSRWRSIRQLGRALLILAVVIGCCTLFFKWQAPSRMALILLVVTGGGLLSAKENFIRAYLKRRALAEGIREKLIFAGEPDDIEMMLNDISDDAMSQIEISAKIDLSTQSVEDLVDALHEHAVERVIFAAGHVHFGKVQEAISACEMEGVEAWLSTHFIKTVIARPTFDVYGGRLMMVFSSTPGVSWALLIKNMFDRVGALISLIFAIPVLLISYIGIRMASPGPVVFKQQRGGKNGKPFTMYKLRTMDLDAEDQREALAEDNQMSGPVFKVERDPRVFKFGSLLRKMSVDELPQLVNVLLGDMSLVGPRPLPTYEIEKIEHSAQRRRMSVKPGLTCIWQAGGRNKITSFEEWVAMDLDYIDNWSLWLDFKILLKTIPAVLFSKGAK
ncbi:MAG: exopolysaccharide biosynthesis polyprenyl glycosylphosphotransferase [Verrucomicrobiales bacterium]|jgi:exopolysaccharide biosynthesis polyprenyl glycosylphosphotransferase